MGQCKHRALSLLKSCSQHGLLAMRPALVSSAREGIMPASSSRNATSLLLRPTFSPIWDCLSTRAVFGFAAEPPVVHGPIFHSQNPPEECSAEALYLSKRREGVQQYFTAAMGVDDFLARVEIELCKNGFTGDNSIAVLNLCRDEICNSLKRKIELVFGEPFNLIGLAGVLTCGVTGMGAGLSHAPMLQHSSRERYIFFSFPHVAVNAAGELGKISRAARPDSAACGALLKVLEDLKGNGRCRAKSVAEAVDELDPEYSILRHRLSKAMAESNTAVEDLDLASLTLLAEKTITKDLELLIEHCVDTSKADYAVVTGIQIHNWADSFGDEEPSFEFVHPSSIYTVIHGRKSVLDLTTTSALTPRMIRILAGSAGPSSDGSSASAGGGGAAALLSCDDNLPRSKHSIRRNMDEERTYQRLAERIPDADGCL